MQSYLSEMLARERIADFRRDADRDRLAVLARVARRRRARGPKRAIVAHQPERAPAGGRDTEDHPPARAGGPTPPARARLSEGTPY
jgi:hypothetical protein